MREEEGLGIIFTSSNTDGQFCLGIIPLISLNSAFSGTSIVWIEQNCSVVD